MEGKKGVFTALTRGISEWEDQKEEEERKRERKKKGKIFTPSCVQMLNAVSGVKVHPASVDF